MMKNTDLHCHSIFSDGELSPKELVKEAKKIKLRCISLTDHNSISGVKVAIKEGKKIGVEVIPGVEIYSDCSEILGYFVDLNNKELLKLLKKIKKREDNDGKRFIKKLNKAGYKINYNEVIKKFGYPAMKINCIRCISSKELNIKKSEEILQEMRKETYYVGGKFYFEQKLEEAEKIIKIIIKSKGIPVLAHPWLEKNWEKRILGLVNAGLRGIEFDGPIGSRNHTFKIDKKKIDKLAKQYDLIKTGGSDFHGKWRNPLGSHGCDYKVVDQLKKLLGK